MTTSPMLAPTVTTMILFTVQESRLAPNIGFERLSKFAHFGVEYNPYLLRQGDVKLVSGSEVLG